MGLESTYICVDSSEFQRNGDFVPSRLQAQMDAVNLVSQCKLRSHPENQVGLIGMTDKVDVLATLTTDNNKLFMKLHQLKPKGYCRFLTAIKIAHLALKHRQNRNHRMRIVIFIGSPVADSQEEMVQVAKKLKKEKVSLDAVCFGENEMETSEKLTAFVDTLNGKEGTGSHLVVVPPGSQLTEALITSPVCRGEDGGPVVGVGGGGGAGFGDFGMDPNEDPELAMALRVSLEEQRQRQEQEAAATVPAGGAEESPAAAGAPAAVTAVADDAMDVNFEAMTEEEQLAYALRMSMAQDSAAEETKMEVESSDTAGTSAGVKAETKSAGKAEGSNDEEDSLAALMQDPAALQSLVATLPGVDPSSELIQEALGNTPKEKAGATKKEDTNKKK